MGLTRSRKNSNWGYWKPRKKKAPNRLKLYNKLQEEETKQNKIKLEYKQRTGAY